LFKFEKVSEKRSKNREKPTYTKKNQLVRPTDNGRRKMENQGKTISEISRTFPI
jgi:hypothetical protein